MTPEEHARRRSVIAVAARYVAAKERHPKAMFAHRATVTRLNTEGQPTGAPVEVGPLVIW